MVIALQDLEKKFLEVLAENKRILAENKQMSAKLETLELSYNKVQKIQKTADEYQKMAEELSAENEVYELICYSLNQTQTLKHTIKLMAKDENALQTAEYSDENMVRILVALKS